MYIVKAENMLSKVFHSELINVMSSVDIVGTPYMITDFWTLRYVHI